MKGIFKYFEGKSACYHCRLKTYLTVSYILIIYFIHVEKHTFDNVYVENRCFFTLRFEMMPLFISLHRIIYILYLFDGALLQMFLHCFLDEKLLLVKLHPRVFFHNIFHDGLVWNPKPVITRLQRKWTRNHTHKTLYNKEKTNNKHTHWLCWEKSVHTVIASMRILSTLFWVPAKLVTGTFLLPVTLAHAGIVLFTFLTLAFSYL